MVFKWFGRNVRDNAAKGEAGERRVMERYKAAGWKIERTGHGHDFKATRNDGLASKTRYVEVKTGNAKLSPLQKRKKRRLGKKYVVENGDPLVSFHVPSKRPPDRKSSGAASWLGSSKGGPGSVRLFGPSKGRRSRATRWTI